MNEQIDSFECGKFLNDRERQGREIVRVEERKVQTTWIKGVDHAPDNGSGLSRVCMDFRTSPLKPLPRRAPLR